jgi:hypothetical protein
MKRKAIYLVTAAAELLRFLAILVLADALGAFRDPGSAKALRLAAVPQLLFAAGFFFLWLDPALYAPYKPLIGVGKAASLAALIPIPLYIQGEGRLLPGYALALASAAFVAFVDFLSLAALALSRHDRAQGPDGGNPPAVDDDRPGQGPADIERVEG